jgi:alcohol dehydrogenase (cytochrome c)
MCPSTFGGRNWPSTAVDPRNAILYVPMFESCMEMSLAWDMSREQPVSGNSGMKNERPRNTDGLFGRIAALDLRTGKIIWTDRQRSPVASALLATAGGLVFAGTDDGNFRALDSATGKILWQTRLAETPGGFPVSFAVGGKQYVAIVGGGHTPLALATSSFTPELPDAGTARTIWVFALGGS